MDSLLPTPPHIILSWLLQIAVLLLAARALGEIAQRWGQPAVLGELLAGILLGPSGLSRLVPIVGQWLLPHQALQWSLLDSIGLIGAMCLLLLTGLETDLALIRRHARTAMGVSAGGVLVTFASGLCLGLLLPDFLLANPAQRMVFALFVATAMSISAIPVIAKVLMDMNLIRRDIGQTILAAGMSDDTTGWMLLSIVAGLAAGQSITGFLVAISIGKIVLFIGGFFTLGRWLLRRALIFVQDEVRSRDRYLTLVIVAIFLGGAIAQSLHLEPVLGAFVVGILFGQMRNLPHDVFEKIESLTKAIFAPIFFAIAGLKMDVMHLFTPSRLTIALVVILVATLGKVVGTYLGARLIGRRDHWTALAYGAGLNARGAMEIIVATIGLSLGILTREMFSIIVLMAMATTLMSPFALRWVLRHVRPSRRELRRLEQERALHGNLIAGIHRILMPVRLRSDLSCALPIIEARLLERVRDKTALSVTLLTVVQVADKSDAADYLNALAAYFPGQEVIKRIVVGKRAAALIIEEAQKNYDLVVLGASEAAGRRDALFSTLIDAVVREAPCPTLVVQSGSAATTWEPHRILVPTNGAAAAKRAVELAFALTRRDHDQVFIQHVVVREGKNLRDSVHPENLEQQLTTGRQIVADLCRLGTSLNVQSHGDVQIGPNPETVILATVRAQQMDLIILGIDVRPGSERLFLGPGVERILANAPCPVLVLNAG